jgi:hypothetical protein
MMGEFVEKVVKGRRIKETVMCKNKANMDKPFRGNIPGVGPIEMWYCDDHIDFIKGRK